MPAPNQGHQPTAPARPLSVAEVVYRRTFEVKVLAIVFGIKMVPWLFFMLWPDPQANPLYPLNVAHTLFSILLVGGFFVSVPLMGVGYALAWKIPPGPKWGRVRKGIFGVLHYILLTPPMALIAFSLRAREIDFGF